MPAASENDQRLPAVALMLGNLVFGLAVLAPAGMIEELAAGLAVSIREAGLLIAFGAIVLCICSPLTVWATSAIDRRALLTAALVVLTIGHAVSALAPDYLSLLAVRLVMLALTALFTPLAASTIALIVPPEKRPSRIAFVFIGWSLALAAGIPIVAILASNFGWRATYGAMAAGAALNTVFLFLVLPAGLRGVPLSLESWKDILRNRRIVLLLSISVLWICSFYVVFPYIEPLLGRLAGGTAQIAAAFFAVMGITGLVGNLAATALVGRLGPFRTMLIGMLAMLIGALLWTFGAGSLTAMGIGIALWGFGCAATPSMIQARLVAAAPALSSGTVALNTSWLYVGQALGSWLGGVLIARELPLAMGYVAIAFIVAALGVLALTRETPRASP